ncbi:hypothetical protein [Vibrio phage vB_VmeM-Yong XC32]|nr:hypothetical protein [Vibrio phage vB_VmeM-Yong XC31]QAX96370.1 hypothetical protein [Vibrio phage vB_VmeM-Yong XC32]QAX96688.1 hypothetical protein [Vibrio phage vB_VmeM-Yong MS31]QAX97006.1 hypothetical protein [Vibrio phage vB_VmeM-Yong MS32]
MKTRIYNKEKRFLWHRPVTWVIAWCLFAFYVSVQVDAYQVSRVPTYGKITYKGQECTRRSCHYYVIVETRFGVQSVSVGRTGYHYYQIGEVRDFTTPYLMGLGFYGTAGTAAPPNADNSIWGTYAFFFFFVLHIWRGLNVRSRVMNYDFDDLEHPETKLIENYRYPVVSVFLTPFLDRKFFWDIVEEE